MKWFDRKFDFSFQSPLEVVKQRLWGSQYLYEIICKNLDHDLLILKPEGNWSIKEHIGHIIDLEPLWQGRLDDILADKEYMREADLSNKKTHQAGHNSTSINKLIEDLFTKRTETLRMLSNLTENDIINSSKHPRLHIPMHIPNLFYFVAEHDDHHLAKIAHIIDNNGNKNQ